MPNFVLKLGGAVLSDPDTLDAVADELKEVRERGIVVFVVHGGGPQLDMAIKALGEPVVKHRGLRVTSVTGAATVKSVMDQIGADLAAALTARGVPARNIPTDRGLFEAKVKDLGDGVDLGRVGTMVCFHHRFSTPTTAEHPVQVLTPVGLDESGPLNVNADEGAAAVADAVEADWFLMGTDVDHVRDADGNPVRVLDEDGARRLIETEAAEGGMIPKLEAACHAVAGGTGQVLITRVVAGRVRGLVLDGRPDGTLVMGAAKYQEPQP